MKTACFYQWYFFISTAAKKPKLLFVAFCTYWFQWTKKSLQRSFSHFPGFPEAGGTFSLQSQKLLHHFIFISLLTFQLWKVHIYLLCILWHEIISQWTWNQLPYYRKPLRHISWDCLLSKLRCSTLVPSSTVITSIHILLARQTKRHANTYNKHSGKQLLVNN